MTTQRYFLRRQIAIAAAASAMLYTGMALAQVAAPAKAAAPSAAVNLNQTVKIAWLDPLSGLMAAVGTNQLKSFQFLADRFSQKNKAGVKFDLASPVGGFAPFDGFDLKDQATLDFWTNPEHRNRLGTTLRLADVNAADYASVLLVGGHGPMWDFVDNPRLDAVVRTIYEQGGLVSAVCHGPAGLLGVTLSDGSPLLKGRRITGFTAEEEAARKYDTIVPFELESARGATGASFSESPIFEPKVVVDGRIITGQNPASATPLGEAIVSALQDVK